MQNSTDQKDLYKDSGVDVAKADKLVKWLQDDSSSSSSASPEIGGFSAIYKPNFKEYETPYLVSATDGVGTKLLLGLEYNQIQGLGIDLVAMCANDLITCGADPLFFLDYFATSKLDESQFKSIITGIKDGLRQCDATLAGGETAELPNLYQKNHFDLAGFMVGMVDKSKMLGTHKVKCHDDLIAIESNGFHSNGYSLIRSWLKQNYTNKKPETHLIQKLLRPTKIYSELIRIHKTIGRDAVHAMAHITGGGISGNLARIIPDNLQAVIDWNSIETPTWMSEFIEYNGTSLRDLEHTFNCGVGMIVAIAPNERTEFISQCNENSLKAYSIGSVVPKSNNDTQVHYC